MGFIQLRGGRRRSETGEIINELRLLGLVLATDSGRIWRVGTNVKPRVLVMVFHNLEPIGNEHVVSRNSLRWEYINFRGSDV